MVLTIAFRVLSCLICISHNSPLFVREDCGNVAAFQLARSRIAIMVLVAYGE